MADELAIVHRLDQRTRRKRVQPAAHRLRDAGIRMHWEHHAQILARGSDLAQRIADDLGVAVVVLTPMQGDQHEAVR